MSRRWHRRARSSEWRRHAVAVLVHGRRVGVVIVVVGNGTGGCGTSVAVVVGVVGVLGCVLPHAAGPVQSLDPHPLFYAVSQSVVVLLVEGGEDALLEGFVLVSTRVDFGDEHVEIRVGAQRPFGDEFLSAGRAFLVAAAESRNDAVLTKPVKAFLSCHSVL